MAIDAVSLATRSGLLDIGPKPSSGIPAAGAIDQAMGAIDQAAGVTAQAAASGTTSQFGLSQDSFFKLFLAQLQNQDPTQPLDNKAMLDQLGQFTMIDTLNSVQRSLQGTQLAQASSLIGKQVSGLGVDGSPVTGTVQQLMQSQGALTLMVDGVAVKADAVTVVTAGIPPAGGTVVTG
jgi:flagellar basal-body rod modification protein FlgD